MTTHSSYCPLAQQAIERPEAIALIERQRENGVIHYSYAQLHHQVEQRRLWLLQQGITAGQRLLIASEDKAEIVRLLLASLRLGSVLIPINPAFPEVQQRVLIQSFDADGFIDQPGRANSDNNKKPQDNAKLADRCRSLALTGDDQNNHPQTPGRISAIPIEDPDAPLSGVLTSGTGGTPKLALHSYRNHAASAAGSRSLISLQPGDGWALALPLDHISGQAIVFRCLLAGASLIIPAVNETLQQLLLEPHLTHLSAVPTQLLGLQRAGVNLDNSTLQQLLIGGGVIPSGLLNWLSQQPLQSWISYGLTEMSSQVMTGAINPEGKLASLLPHCQLRLSADNEILVRGDSLFLGYYRSTGCQLPLDHQGWFHTRDLGFLDSQQQLSIRGRMDNQFISGGENIQPESIELVIAAYPGIDNCILVPVDDPYYGQRSVAFITPLTAIDSAQLERWLRQRLPRYQVPIHYLQLPTSEAALKISRVELIRLAAKLVGINSDPPGCG